jgi:hypothetical protein
MRKAGLVGLVVALVVGSATAGYALASRPVEAPARPEPVECAVPAAVEAPAPLVIEPAPEPVREETPAPGPGRPSARRLIVTHAIEDREPVDDLEVVDDLSRGDRLYAFVELANAGDATEVDVVFRHESGLSVGHVALALPAHVRRHRTWAYSTRVEEPGNWTAVVRDRDGRTLAVTSFEVR